MIKKILLILPVILCLSPLTSSQINPNAVLDSLQQKFESINDLSADIIQSANGNIRLSGKVYYKRDNKLRFEFQNLIIVSDGQTNWNYNKKANKVIISAYEDEDPELFSLERILYEYPKECELNAYLKDGQTILDLIPIGKALNFNSAKLFITDDDLISKIMIDDNSMGLIELDISNYELNRNISDIMFSITPPEGSKIIDLR